MFKIVSILFAFFALLNTVDVHALSHVIDGDDHNTIEKCETCEEFIVANEDEQFILLKFTSVQFSNTLINYNTSIVNTEFALLHKGKHLGKFYNKPPPFSN